MTCQVERRLLHERVGKRVRLLVGTGGELPDGLNANVAWHIPSLAKTERCIAKNGELDRRRALGFELLWMHTVGDMVVRAVFVLEGLQISGESQCTSRYL